MQQWINHAERKQKKKPRSASLIRLISKAIYLCGDYVGILLAEWIAFHIRNFLMRLYAARLRTSGLEPKRKRV